MHTVAQTSPPGAKSPSRIHIQTVESSRLIRMKVTMPPWSVCHRTKTSITDTRSKRGLHICTVRRTVSVSTMMEGDHEMYPSHTLTHTKHIHTHTG